MNDHAAYVSPRPTQGTPGCWGGKWARPPCPGKRLESPESLPRLEQMCHACIVHGFLNCRSDKAERRRALRQGREDACGPSAATKDAGAPEGRARP